VPKVSSTNTERAVTWGLLGFIAYQLYQCCHGTGDAGCSPPLSIPSSGEGIPDWVGQLGESYYGQDLTRPACGIFGRCG
jgi:hypothetical protein